MPVLKEEREKERKDREREKRERKKKKRERKDKERRKGKKKEKEELGLHKAVFQDLECIMSKKDEAANQSFSQVIL